jgi:20S proteasome alpha/beta subunit
MPTAQAAFIAPEIRAQPITNEAETRRRMTYQVTMRGHDGIVMASDQREYLAPESPEQGEGAVTNMLTKITLDSTRRFAWAFAGGKPSYLAAGYLEREFENGVTDDDLERTLRNCGDLGWEAGASGPSDSTIVFADGKNKNILRATLGHKSTRVFKFAEGRCFTGQSWSKASFFPIRFYSPEMSVTQLAKLAAFTVIMAGEMDQLCVAGLDMAIYRDSVGHFEFVDSHDYSQQVMKLEADIRSLFVS